MNAKELEKLYGCGAHHTYAWNTWRDVVATGLTRLGYWDWVAEQLKPKPKTDAEYVANPGHCPYCDSTCVEFVSGWLAEGADATVAEMCNSCGLGWSNDYNLVGWRALK